VNSNGAVVHRQTSSSLVAQISVSHVTTYITDHFNVCIGFSYAIQKSHSGLLMISVEVELLNQSSNIIKENRNHLKRSLQKRSET